MPPNTSRAPGTAMHYHPSIDERNRVCHISHSLFQAAFDDWAMMVGVEAQVKQCMARIMPFLADSITRIVKDGVLVETRVNGAADAPIYFVFPSTFVGPAVFQALMMPESDDRVLSPEDEGHLGAAKELMNLFCGSATRALQEEGFGTLRVSQSVDDICIHFTLDDLSCEIQDGSLVCVQLEVEYKDKPHRSWCLLPESLSRTFAA